MPGKGSYLNAAMTITSCRDCEQHTVMRRRPCSQYVPSMPIRAAPCVDRAVLTALPALEQAATEGAAVATWQD